MSFEDIASYLMRCNPMFKATERRLRASFGVDPYLCDIIWMGLLKSGWKKYAGRKAKKFHLLWDLYILIFYATNEVSEVHMGVYENTFHQWSWFYTEGICWSICIMWFVSIIVDIYGYF